MDKENTTAKPVATDDKEGRFARLEKAEERYAAAVARFDHRHWLWKRSPSVESFDYKVRANMAACSACERLVRHREDVGRETASLIKAEAERLQRIANES